MQRKRLYLSKHARERVRERIGVVDEWAAAFDARENGIPSTKVAGKVRRKMDRAMLNYDLDRKCHLHKGHIWVFTYDKTALITVYPAE